MSGHSKWSTIKHKKAILDQKRGATFSKLSKDISIAAREGKSGDPEQNPRLRLIIQKAREANLPSDNIKRAIERGLGGGNGSNLEEIVYEGYSPGGVAILVVVKTDNRQRTTSTIKHLFEETGASLGSPGSAVFLFEKREGKFMAKNTFPVAENDRLKLVAFIEKLEATDDVSAVYANTIL